MFATNRLQHIKFNHFHYIKKYFLLFFTGTPCTARQFMKQLAVEKENYMFLKGLLQRYSAFVVNNEFL